jgi:hypothetical protein
MGAGLPPRGGSLHSPRPEPRRRRRRRRLGPARATETAGRAVAAIPVAETTSAEPPEKGIEGFPP